MVFLRGSLPFCLSGRTNISKPAADNKYLKMRLTWTTLAPVGYFELFRHLVQNCCKQQRNSSDFVFLFFSKWSLPSGIQTLPTSAAAQMYLLEKCHTMIAVRGLISLLQASCSYQLSQYKQREIIFQCIQIKKVKNGIMTVIALFWI